MKINLDKINNEYESSEREWDSHNLLTRVGFQRMTANMYHKNHLVCIIKSNSFVLKHKHDPDAIKTIKIDLEDLTPFVNNN